MFGWKSRDALSCLITLYIIILLSLTNSSYTHLLELLHDEHLIVLKLLMNARPDGAIIVTTPQEVAMATIRKEINFCHKMKLKIIGVVENMSGFVCPCCQVCIHNFIDSQERT